jgi:hypothetical protein
MKVGCLGRSVLSLFLNGVSCVSGFEAGNHQVGRELNE